MSTSKLALLGGTPTGSVSSGQHPRFSQDAVDRIVELLKRGVTVGSNMDTQENGEAEEAIAEWQGIKYCLGTSSGHAALHSSLIGLEVTFGDEVITLAAIEIII